MVPYAGLSFYCFESLKYWCMKHAAQWTCEPCLQNTGDTNKLPCSVSNIFYPISFCIFFSGGLVLKLPAKLLCGGFAGAIAQSFAYPFDVTRRRMQLAQMTPDMQHWG